MHDYKIEITREGKWWMIHIPDIEGLTQARRLSEATTMAREYISLAQGIPVDTIRIEVASIRMDEPEFRELLELATGIRSRRAQAAEIDKQVTRDAHQFALMLNTYGVPVRDIAELLDVSPQRVSQLANMQVMG